MTVFCKKKKGSVALNVKKGANAINSKKLARNQADLNKKYAKMRQNRPFKHDKSASKKLIVKNKTIRVLLDSGSSGDLLFMKKGASNDIPVIKRAVPQS
jgi:hypothetical protein